VVKIGTNDETASAPVDDGSVWDRIAQCEATGNGISTGNSYYGAPVRRGRMAVLRHGLRGPARPTARQIVAERCATTAAAARRLARLLTQARPAAVTPSGLAR
jgi:hypothetical protein